MNSFWKIHKNCICLACKTCLVAVIKYYLNWNTKESFWKSKAVYKVMHFTKFWQLQMKTKWNWTYIYQRWLWPRTICFPFFQICCHLLWFYPARLYPLQNFRLLEWVDWVWWIDSLDARPLVFCKISLPAFETWFVAGEHFWSASLYCAEKGISKDSGIWAFDINSQLPHQRSFLPSLSFLHTV